MAEQKGKKDLSEINYFKTTVLAYSWAKFFTLSQPTSFKLLLAKGHNWSLYTQPTSPCPTISHKDMLELTSQIVDT